MTITAFFNLTFYEKLLDQTRTFGGDEFTLTKAKYFRNNRQVPKKESTKIIMKLGENAGECTEKRTNGV
jgi:hypothetical protein